MCNCLGHPNKCPSCSIQFCARARRCGFRSRVHGSVLSKDPRRMLRYGQIGFVCHVHGITTSTLTKLSIDLCVAAVGRVMISEKAKTRTLWMRRLLLLVLFVGLYTGFFVVWGWQASGEYR